MLKRLIALGLGLGAMITALPAHAEDCASRDLVTARLTDEFSEQLTAGGLQDASDAASIVEVWASPETGTFTVMLTDAQGVSCILATGTDWIERKATADLTDIAS
ncbi:hypothetical protein RXV86_11135 [Alisedimentitalea sp. MJ-SS2]|uniref:hypothetical protein n=1 Tax=Aliisedimentitalea sp. MJ-SS2 TaxID=3049795 RepID=UPI0029086349|nr:hypothetical protein [Alisedimentitalea sp. MJ-SS2]MDU8927938.1 hypothetical protein [Alisedimentitalea sp. MJ-SS2]